MEYRELGKSGLRVSEISLGCWAIGGPAWRDGNPVGWSGADDGESLAGLRRAFELGVNHFDTADTYGDGHSERLVGQFLKDVPRGEVVIATKVGWFRGTAENAYEPAHIRHQFEQSLINLGTDYVDIYYFHHAHFGPQDRYLHGAAEVVQRLKEQGKVRVVGQSAYSYEDFKRVCPVTQPQVCQFRYHALSPTFDEPQSDLFAWCEAQGCGMVLFSPLAQGLLLDKYDPEHPPTFGGGDIRAVREGFSAEALRALRPRLARLKERFGATTQDLIRVALQYGLARSPSACVIPGFKNARQVAANCAAAGKPLSADDVAFIRQVLRG
jgi:myo-inositol catabolism protein IolS